MGSDVILQPWAGRPVACQGAGVPPLSDVFVNNIFALTQKPSFWRLVGGVFLRTGAEEAELLGTVAGFVLKGLQQLFC